MNNAGGDGLFPTRWSLPVDKFALNFGTVLRVLKRNVRHALIGFPASFNITVVPHRTQRMEHDDGWLA